MIETFAREQRIEPVLKLAALPHEPIEAILLKRGISRDSIAEVKHALAAVDVVVDARQAVAYSFREPYGIGRFGDGRFPVFYAALEDATCVAEISHRYKQRVNEQASGVIPYDRYYDLITCQFGGLALMLLGAESTYPDLVSTTEEGYPFCQRLAKAAIGDGVDALYTRSARALQGTCVPVFDQGRLRDPAVVARFRFYSNAGQTLTERLPIAEPRTGA